MAPINKLIIKYCLKTQLNDISIPFSGMWLNQNNFPQVLLNLITEWHVTKSKSYQRAPSEMLPYCVRVYSIWSIFTPFTEVTMPI